MKGQTNRRDLLKLGACCTGALALRPLASKALYHPAPVIDAHIHLFDPSRTGGVPWPEKDDTTLYRPALPGRYEALAAPCGVVGAIAIEASPLATDNQWLLNLAARNPLIVGVIGDLVPVSPSYLSELEQLHRDPLFLGFRYGNLWKRDLSLDLLKPGFVDGLKALAQAGLVFETANPDARLIQAVLNISDQVPDLRIVIDHLPHATVPAETAAREAYSSDLRRLAHNPKVYIKLSEIPVLRNGNLVKDPQAYKEPLDAIWDIFGEGHILFGSDWPNSELLATYSETFAIVREYISQNKAAASDKFFWQNSIAAYQWRHRKSGQPG